MPDRTVYPAPDDDAEIPGTAGFYLSALDVADRHALMGCGEDEVLDNALTAICHAVDGEATSDDHRALLAWATRLRLRGEGEEQIASLLAVATDVGRKLGVQL